MFGPGRERHLVRIKICGITAATDAEQVIECGADALGLNFFRESRRYIDIKSARHWIARLPQDIAKIAVVVDPTWEEAIELAELPFIDSLQLHGSESPEFCLRLAERGIVFAKALPMVDDKSLSQTTQFSTNAILLDSGGASGFGGTGRPFSWELGRRFVQSHPDLQVILAGGLTPENVGEAVGTVNPFGVDVTSGVELAPGRKDPARVRAFIDAVRGTSK